MQLVNQTKITVNVNNVSDLIVLSNNHQPLVATIGCNNVAYCIWRCPASVYFEKKTFFIRTI